MTAPHICDPDDSYPLRDTGITCGGKPIYICDHPGFRGLRLVSVSDVQQHRPTEAEALRRARDMQNAIPCELSTEVEWTVTRNDEPARVYPAPRAAWWAWLARMLGR